MMAANVNWHPQAFENNMERRLNRNLDKAALRLERYIVGSFGSGGKKGKRSGAKKQEREPSRPGMPPNVQSGTMRRSIANETPKRFVRRIGSTLRPARGQAHSYPLYLEYGTRHIEARPWARPALKANKTAIKRDIMAK